MTKKKYKCRRCPALISSGSLCPDCARKEVDERLERQKARQAKDEPKDKEK